MKNCESCNGSGFHIWSCCGDDITDSEVLRCPTCQEMCAAEPVDCESCKGYGQLNTDVYDTPAYIIQESNSHKDYWIFTNKKTGFFFMINANKEQIIEYHV